MKGAAKPPTFHPNDNAPVSYLAIRDRFLARFVEPEADAQHLIEIGRFVVDRWMAEERLREQGGKLNEQETDKFWDECTEAHLRNLSAEAIAIFNNAATNRWKRAVADTIKTKFHPVAGAIKILGWIVLTATQGFVSAIGLIAFGLLFVWAAPSITKSVRSAIDDTLPKETRPTVETDKSVADKAKEDGS